MRDSVNEAIASTVRDMMEINLEVSFTEKDLNMLGVKVDPVTITADDIQKIGSNK